MAFLSGLRIATIIEETQHRKEAGFFDPEDIARGLAGPAIVIEDFDKTPSDEGGRLNPNSYNLRLGPILKFPKVAMNPLPAWAASSIIRNWTDCDKADWKQYVIDMAKPVEMEEHVIPPGGVLLFPGHLYLGSTIEWTEAYGLVPCIEGRSSVARVGAETHQAGWGDCGFTGRWTLEIQVVYPTVVYAGMEICQLSFSPVVGPYRPYQSKKYQGQTGPVESKIYREAHKWQK